MHRDVPAVLLALILCALMLFGCTPKIPEALINEIVENLPFEPDAQGGGSDDFSAPADLPEQDAADIGNITGIVDAWTEMSSLHSEAVNSYDNSQNLFLPLQLVSPDLTLAMTSQYDLLNLNNTNGRFEGELMFTGQKAFVEKNGDKLVFGSDHIADSATGAHEAGDRLVENGEADLSKVWLKSEEYVERDGERITYDCIEVVKMSDGSMALLYLTGSTISGETGAVFIHAGESVYEYVVASAAFGVDFSVLSLGNGFDKAQARSFLESAGYTVSDTGSDVGGKLIAD